MNVSLLWLSLFALLSLFQTPKDYVCAQFSEGIVLTRNDTFCKNNYYNWPDCIDNPAGYKCICGPGFFWNTKQCISDAVDSRLEFPPSVVNKNKTEFAYTLLLGKPFPRLDKFTLSMYVKPALLTSRRAVFSYSYRAADSGYQQLSLWLGQGIDIYIANQSHSIKYPLRKDTWTHLAITWSSLSGDWILYADAVQINSGFGFAAGSIVESGGFLVLGQAAPEEGLNYNSSYSYIGSLVHVNVWEKTMNATEILRLFRDCTFTHCGDGIEWVDFRLGTRGISKLKWPSGLKDDKPCFTLEQSETTCDKYCSNEIGIQCKSELQESIEWSRTQAKLGLLVVPCPGYTNLTNDTIIPKANRSCSGEGVWGLPQVDNCLSPFYLSFTRKVRSYMLGESFDKLYVLELLRTLGNQTRAWAHDNPVDLSAAVKSLTDLIDSQRKFVEDLMYDKVHFSVTYSDLSRERSLKYEDTINIINMNAEIINDLLSHQNNKGWNMTIPPGYLADRLIQVVDSMCYTAALSMRYHLLNRDVAENKAVYRRLLNEFGLKVKVVKRRVFFGETFPDSSDLATTDLKDELSALTVVSPTHANSNLDAEYIMVALVRLNHISRLLKVPKNGKNDNINTAVFGLRIFGDKLHALNQNGTAVLKLPYADSFNISDPTCVQIVHGESKRNKLWGLSPTNCSIKTSDSKSVSCECRGYGFFTATTDMFNDNWRIPEPPHDLMTLPSYLGCSISVFLSLCTLGMLIYVGTSSRTAVLHKNFAIAVACNTATFMIGITLTLDETACKAFAILFHYFFLSMYSWLMNEAFNLYISITYTAHHQNAAQSGYWRYYALGWVLPAVLVGFILGFSFNSYFSTEMCWVSWNNIWIFCGPPVAMIGVSLLVMTFAAKENNEVSYTKNESANKLTDYHSNAVWTQIILVTCTWAFAFLSLKFRSIVFKWVFFIFNSAQGFFLFVFFFLLNDEVRSVFKTKQIKQQLGLDVGIGDYSEDTTPEETIPLTTQEHSQPNSPVTASVSVSEKAPAVSEKAPAMQTADTRGALASKASHFPNDVELEILTETCV